MRKEYKTSGTCARLINIDVDENGIIQNVEFVGGCNGNTKGISRLVKGRKASEVADILRGTQCGMRGTSCPDQLAKALDEMNEE